MKCGQEAGCTPRHGRDQGKERGCGGGACFSVLGLAPTGASGMFQALLSMIHPLTAGSFSVETSLVTCCDRGELPLAEGAFLHASEGCHRRCRSQCCQRLAFKFFPSTSLVPVGSPQGLTVRLFCGFLSPGGGKVESRCPRLFRSHFLTQDQGLGALSHPGRSTVGTLCLAPSKGLAGSCRAWQPSTVITLPEQIRMTRR